MTLEPVKVSLRLATLDYDRTVTLLLKLLRCETTDTIEAQTKTFGNTCLNRIGGVKFSLIDALFDGENE